MKHDVFNEQIRNAIGLGSQFCWLHFFNPHPIKTQAPENVFILNPKILNFVFFPRKLLL